MWSLFRFVIVKNPLKLMFNDSQDKYIYCRILLQPKFSYEALQIYSNLLYTVSTVRHCSFYSNNAVKTRKKLLQCTHTVSIIFTVTYSYMYFNNWLISIFISHKHFWFIVKWNTTKNSITSPERCKSSHWAIYMVPLKKKTLIWGNGTISAEMLTYIRGFAHRNMSSLWYPNISIWEK